MCYNRMSLGASEASEASEASKAREVRIKPRDAAEVKGMHT
jgi:hypothetical protein